ncbi:hypothetical protein EV690_1437 [Celerinatantimonas diazotrophica]|uniref:Uncharacterized protein n=1 Tax=Celerinatantimonas diazotrophica TaxID=412034 RepID=A0A4R1K237_9GAMM|nr:hypothetical protein EV690_1437 [Celerinatantimonas diazotrophica]CAG9298195.1 hypothetical protein CEDIAZO_03390 [Celerinatantimonas diazotrophica]
MLARLFILLLGQSDEVKTKTALEAEPPSPPICCTALGLPNHKYFLKNNQFTPHLGKGKRGRAYLYLQTQKGPTMTNMEGLTR